MPTTVSLQGKFIYGVFPILIMLIILALPFIIKAVNRRKAKKEQKRKSKVQAKPLPVPLPAKQSYVNKLERLVTEYKGGKRDSRDCYQLLSTYIRAFALEYAGIDVTNKTLAEIRGMSISKVERLIEEYYACEFAPDVSGDIEKAVRKTIDVISNW